MAGNETTSPGPAKNDRQPDKKRKKVFLEMAGEHQNWINSLMSGVHGQEEAFGETLKNIRSDLDNLNQT